MEGAERMNGDPVMAVDISDVDKPYAKKMEYLALMTDGEHGRDKRVRGMGLSMFLGPM